MDSAGDNPPRFPRSMLSSPAAGQVLELLGIEVTDDEPDADLLEQARQWLAIAYREPAKHNRPVTRYVEAALRRHELRHRA